jgi:hypothetical protein
MRFAMWVFRLACVHGLAVAVSPVAGGPAATDRPEVGS